MTSWHPGDGGRDEEFLSHGDDSTPTRPGRLLAAAVALVALGVFAGTWIDGHLAWPGAEPAAVALTGGVVAPAARIDDRHRYRFDLFNPGEEPIRARVVGVAGRLTVVTGNRPVRVGPRSWGRLRFSLPSECHEPPLPFLTEVQVRVTDSDGSREQRVELARPAGALRVVHERECVPATTLGPDDLGGLWIVERIEGRWADLAGITLMRFTADGRFALDPEGQMFREGDQGVRGTYRLQGTRLHLQVDGGYACEKGYSEVWTTTLVEKDVLRLDVVRSDEGYCNSPAHEREVLRRLVPESRLPTAGSLRPG